jgi:hypothetical protein
MRKNLPQAIDRKNSFHTIIEQGATMTDAKGDKIDIDTPEAAPLTEREMAELACFHGAFGINHRALARLRWLEAENADIKDRIATALLDKAAVERGVMRLRAENADLKERIDKAYEDIALDQRTNATLRADLAIAKTDLLLTQARVERFRAHVATLKAKFEGLNDAVEEACGELPEDWGVRVDLERGAATVWLFEPHGESEMVHEDETSISDLVREAVRRAKEVQR